MRLIVVPIHFCVIAPLEKILSREMKDSFVPRVACGINDPTK